MPGYGGTPALPKATFQAFADTLRDLLDELRIERADLVGHSYGGMVAQEFACRHASRLRTLTLSGTSPAFGKPDGEWQREFVRQRLEPLERGVPMADLARAAIPSLVGDNPDPEGLRLALASSSAVPAEAFATGMRLIVTFDRRDALATIAVPTLVLAGERDNNAPAAMMEKMASKIPGAKYVCLPGAGHLANLERPAAYNATLAEFLAAH
jgi:3-oxoadipate enol-lactonase